MQQLEPSQIKAWRIVKSIEFFGLVAIGIGLKFFLDSISEIDLWWLVAVLALFGIAQLLILPIRKYRSWSYQTDPDELHIHSGVLMRHETVIPLGRVQHIDVAQGPIERICKVCRLVLHTAGTHNNIVKLPGLSRETAEALRDSIRIHIRNDLI